jgi:hypothetical protein
MPNIDFIEALSLALIIGPATLFALFVIWMGVKK